MTSGGNTTLMVGNLERTQDGRIRGSQGVCGAWWIVPVLALAMSHFLAPLASAGTWYVDQNNSQCNNSGPGTEQEPFCAIGAGAALAVAGDTVVVAAGTYAEQVTAANSGTTGAPITFIAAPSATVTITGGTYGFKVSGREWITVKDFIVSDTSSSGVYVASSSNVTFSNNQVRNTGDRGIYVKQSSGVTVSDNKVEDTSSYGIYVYFSSEITVSGNHVTGAGQPVSGAIRKGIYFNNAVDSQIANNVVDYNTDSGIYLTNGCTNVQVVSNLTTHNARGYARAAPGIEVRGSSGNTIEANISHENEDTGIQLYPGASNNLVVNNLTYGNGDHGIDNLDAPGQRIIGNTVYDNVTAGINVEGSSSGALLANNISVDNGLNSSPRTKGNIRVDSNSISQTTVDYNLVFQSQPGNVMFQWGDDLYASLGDFTAATGMGTHGLEADPQWQNPGSGDFHLLPSSPAVDSANSGASGALDRDGDFGPRIDEPQTPNTGVGLRAYDDRGAYELNADEVPPVVAITDPDVGVTVSGTVNVAATASDDNAIAGVQFKLDGANLGGEDTAAPYEVSWDTAAVANGPYELTAVARDTANNTTVSDPVNVTVDNASLPTTLTFSPSDDAYIRAGSPGSNYGDNGKLWVDNSPSVYEFLLKFSVSGVGSRQVESAKLWLYNVNSSDKGGDFYEVTDNNWSEQTVTWNTAPSAEANPIASLESVSSNTWVIVDLAPLIAGDGTYSLRARTTSANSAGYFAKETPEFTPQLVIELSN
ncbi:right-handed parallel beta-helix repeat-containing protein [Nitrosococcus watsonii]|uniref:Carbohydrate-binding and sugar hydrolysis n=1 Tax=Nitrosococcus watsoni (strain C-113) TaxID=105559 RepID=D8KBF7_NITWC|nr:right-handed parallel beta-helix repeat-containing protein [Nitrosococcus watsonii]ADJ29604.1 Carbohydrate-binding and sugar hydrolysis [Nitrosococcus watsonii C-113]